MHKTHKKTAAWPPKTFSSDHGEAELRRSARILEPFGAVDQPDNRLCLNSVRNRDLLPRDSRRGAF